MISVCGYVCVFLLCVCSLTYEHREEENGHRDVEDRTGDVKEPVRSHRKEAKEKEEKEQTATIFLHLFLVRGRKKRGQEKEDKEENRKKEKGQRCEKMRENVDESSHTASPGSFLWRI